MTDEAGTGPLISRLSKDINRSCQRRASSGLEENIIRAKEYKGINLASLDDQLLAEIRCHTLDDPKDAVTLIVSPTETLTSLNRISPSASAVSGNVRLLYWSSFG